MNNKIRLLIMGSLFSLSSCISYKNLPYLQDLNPADSTSLVEAYKPDIIRNNDILGIQINSLNTESNVLFGTSDAGVSTESSGSGTMVDAMGEIKLQTIGKIKVAGLTTLQAEALINEKAKLYVKDPNTSIRITNFKVTVLGEVIRPGVFTISNERVNLLEALSLAGDLKISGKRTNIYVIRSENNVLKSEHFDIRSKDIFKSHYFYLKNNDMVYVQPDIQKLQRDENFYRNTTLAVSVITAMTLIFVRLIR